MVRLNPKTEFAGFTLVELLVALAVFAVLSGIVYAALGSALKTRDLTAELNATTTRLMTTVMVMERDFLQMAPRSIRDEFGSRSPALMLERAPSVRAEFTRSGLPNPRFEKRSVLQRVAYSLEDGKLLRRTWLVLDRTAQTTPLEEVLMEEVTSLSFEALLSEWTDAWPPQGSSSVSGTGPAQPLTLLPRAVRFSFAVNEGAEIQRIIPVAGG